MKMKKIAAASLAVCVCALSGMSALAAVDIVTTTGYDYNAQGTDSFTVTSTVTGVTADKQVTYLVWNDSTKAENTIAYIDQAKATGGSATFSFSATKEKLYPASATISAKFGTDDTTNVADVQKTFALNEGVNVIKNGTATVNYLGVDGDTYYGKASGEVAEYGFAVANDDGSYQLYPAAGASLSENAGIFGVTINGLPSGTTPVAYVIGLDGTFSTVANN